MTLERLGWQTSETLARVRRWFSRRCAYAPACRRTQFDGGKGRCHAMDCPHRPRDAKGQGIWDWDWLDRHLG